MSLKLSCDCMLYASWCYFVCFKGNVGRAGPAGPSGPAGEGIQGPKVNHTTLYTSAIFLALSSRTNHIHNWRSPYECGKLPIDSIHLKSDFRVMQDLRVWLGQEVLMEMDFLDPRWCLKNKTIYWYLLTGLWLTDCSQMLQGDRGSQGERGTKGTKGELGDEGVPGELVRKLYFPYK